VSGPVLALCGDIGGPRQESYIELLTWASRNYAWVFLIAGNHEYYHRHDTISEIRDKITLIAERFPNVTFLDNHVVTVVYGKDENERSVNIFGSTLWSDGTGHEYDLKNHMNDYTAIKKKVFEKDGTSYKRLPITPADTTYAHKLAVFALKNAIAKSTAEDRHLVVLTHHLPSHECIHDDYKSGIYSILNCGYATDLTEYLKAPIVLWAHGHSHRCVDTYINGVRVVSNPMGYPAEDTKKYREFMMINIDLEIEKSIASSLDGL
jgi:hypothetical protein